jgi:hypothetical protein
MAADLNMTDYDTISSIQLHKRIIFREDATHIGSTLHYKPINKCQMCKINEESDYSHCQHYCECPSELTMAFGYINVFVKGRPIITTPENSEYLIQITLGESLRSALFESIESASITHEFCVRHTLDEEKSDYRDLVVDPKGVTLVVKYIPPASALGYFDDSMIKFVGKKSLKSYIAHFINIIEHVRTNNAKENKKKTHILD